MKSNYSTPAVGGDVFNRQYQIPDSARASATPSIRTYNLLENSPIIGRDIPDYRLSEREYQKDPHRGQYSESGKTGFGGSGGVFDGMTPITLN